MKFASIIEELRDYCAKAHLKPSTVCVRALNDSRYVSRHYRRLEALEKDAEKLRDYMRAHPPRSQEPSGDVV